MANVGIFVGIKLLMYLGGTMYVPPFSISAKTINLIADISAQIERSSLRFGAEDSLKLRKANRIKTIHSSLAIEGNSLTPDEVSDIINGRIVNAPLKEITEVRNAICCYELFTDLDPYSESDLLRAHSLMMQALTDDAGSYRSTGVGVYAGDHAVHIAPGANRVAPLMNELFSWLRTADDHLLVKSCVFHYEFEFIHPFSDGNGRMGRLWQSLLLSRLSPLFEYLPIENIVRSRQNEYYDAIANSSNQADSGPFIEFMLEAIYDSLIQHRSEARPILLNNSERQILNLLNSDPQSNAKSLSSQLGVSDRQVERILAHLKELGFIERIGSRKKGSWLVLCSE